MKSVPLPYILGIATAFLVAGSIVGRTSPKARPVMADPPPPGAVAAIETPTATPTPPLSITQYSSSRAARATTDGAIKLRIEKVSSPSASELELWLEVVNDIRGPGGSVIVPRNAKVRGTAQRKAGGNLEWRDFWTVSWTTRDTQFEIDLTGDSDDLLAAPTPGRMIGPLPLGVGRTINLVPKTASPLRKVSSGGVR